MKKKAKRTLYLGLEPPPSSPEEEFFHYPVIQIVPYPVDTPAIAEAFQNQKFSEYTHLLFTSKSAVDCFLEALAYHKHQLKNQTVIAVGKGTAAHLQEAGIEVDHIAQMESSEGLVKLFDQINLFGAHLFWPHSALSRNIIQEALAERNIRLTACAMYTTQPQHLLPTPDLEEFDEIFFTSPSTVDAFLQIYKQFPSDIALRAIGPVTEAHLQQNPN